MSYKWLRGYPCPESEVAMQIVCAWCGKTMGEKPPYENKGVTHTICPDCRAKQFPDKTDAP